jgi:dTDP-4-amino-4,6-dideoxygalactose transaminase
MEVWRWYYDAFAELEDRELIRRPIVPEHCRHNAHMFYVIAQDSAVQRHLLRTLNASGINAVFHYVPLHSSPAGQRFGRPHGSMLHTNCVSGRLIRLPLWIGMRQADVERIVSVVKGAFG